MTAGSSPPLLWRSVPTSAERRNRGGDESPLDRATIRDLLRSTSPWRDQGEFRSRWVIGYGGCPTGRVEEEGLDGLVRSTESPLGGSIVSSEYNAGLTDSDYRPGSGNLLLVRLPAETGGRPDFDRSDRGLREDHVRAGREDRFHGEMRPHHGDLESHRLDDFTTCMITELIELMRRRKRRGNGRVARLTTFKSVSHIGWAHRHLLKLYTFRMLAGMPQARACRAL